MEDIVDILRKAGFGVVEGEEAVRKKIAELAEKPYPEDDTTTYTDEFMKNNW